MTNIMNNRYVLPHDAFINLHDISLLMTRIQNEGDNHSNSLATDALELIKKIQDQAQKIWPPEATSGMLRKLVEQGEDAQINEGLWSAVVEEFRLHSHVNNPEFKAEDVWFPDFALVPNGRHFLKAMSNHGMYDDSFAEFIAQVMTNMGWNVFKEMRRAVRFTIPTR